MPFTIITCNVAKGRVYPRSTLESIVEKFNKSDEELLGQIGFPDEPRVSSAEASHVVKSLYMDGDKLMGEIEVLNTPQGKLLKKMIENNSVALRPFGIGILEKDNEGIDVVRDYKLLGVCAKHIND